MTPKRWGLGDWSGCWPYVMLLQSRPGRKATLKPGRNRIGVTRLHA